MKCVFPSLSLLGCLACQHPHELPPAAASALLEAADQRGSDGALIYEGTVSARDASVPPLFRYERRVLHLDETLRSSHLTFSPDDAPVVLHRALHSPDYQLLGFQEIHAQSGLVGSVEMDAEGRAHFQSTVAGQTRTRVEAPGDPLHVGPTLFGYVLENWDSLVAGEVHRIRFVVLKKRRSYGFRLEEVDGAAGRTTFAMTAIHPLVAMTLPSILMRFDEDRRIVSYAGVVPPLKDVEGRLKTLDATVTYDFVAETYE